MGLQRVRQDEWLHFHRGSEEANSADTFEGQLQAETMRLMAEVMPPAWRVYAAARRLESGGGVVESEMLGDKRQRPLVWNEALHHFQIIFI